MNMRTFLSWLLGIVLVAPAGAAEVDLDGLVAGGAPSAWERFNGAEFVEDGDAVAALPGAGTGDRGAFVAGRSLAEGVIEVDLRGADRPGGSFLGVVFGGVDGKRYEAVYFRPFNFGHAEGVKASHAVQYIAHPAWPWRRLRSERPGEFEAAVQPAPERGGWFHARVEIDTQRVRVFVDGADEPSLDVERIGNPQEGKVGVWFNGVAAFKNLDLVER